MPLCIMLQKMSPYGRDFERIKYMSFLIKDNELQEKYNDILEKVSNTIKKDLIVIRFRLQWKISKN